MKRRTAARILAMGLMVVMVTGIAAGCRKRTDSGSSSDGDNKKVSSDVMIGSVIYRFDDTFMTGIRTAMTDRAKEKKVYLELVDSQNNQEIQNEQVDTFITKGANALVINIVDGTAAGEIVNKAKEKNLPVVFLNRIPEVTDIQNYDKVWYVGAKEGQSGTLSGEIIADFFKAHPEADKNGDGTIQYVMIQGDQDQQATIFGTDYSVKALEDAGFQTEQLAADTAIGEKAIATDLMKTLISGQGLDKIEAVLCSNDDMALGAIEALQAEGYNADKSDLSYYIPVVGVDATVQALEAIKEGALLGTVSKDVARQGQAAINVAVAEAAGDEINKESAGYTVTDGKYIWIDYIKVTEDNYQDYVD